MGGDQCQSLVFCNSAHVSVLCPSLGCHQVLLHTLLTRCRLRAAHHNLLLLCNITSESLYFLCKHIHTCTYISKKVCTYMYTCEHYEHLRNALREQSMGHRACFGHPGNVRRRSIMVLEIIPARKKQRHICTYVCTYMSKSRTTTP